MNFVKKEADVGKHFRLKTAKKLEDSKYNYKKVVKKGVREESCTGSQLLVICKIA